MLLLPRLLHPLAVLVLQLVLLALLLKLLEPQLHLLQALLPLPRPSVQPPPQPRIVSRRLSEHPPGLPTPLARKW